MDLIIETILREYDGNLKAYERLTQAVRCGLEQLLAEHGLGQVMITDRIKSRESLNAKLLRKHGKYQSADQVTDIVGFRLISFFADQVDQMAEILDKNFVVDKEKSIDKRELIDPNTFGYVSLHYICSLPEGKGYPEDLCGMQFEIQLKSMLQHTWAEIEHDLGYKSALGVPREVRREFARAASLLEVADDLFVNIKKELREYERDVHERIRTDKADDLALNKATLDEFIKAESVLSTLNREIAEISGAELLEVSSEIYLAQLYFFDIRKIRDLKDAIEEEHDHIMQLAGHTLKDSEIDQLISTVGLYYLCRALLIHGSYSDLKIKEFFALTDKNEESVERKTRYLMRIKSGRI